MVTGVNPTAEEVGEWKEKEEEGIWLLTIKRSLGSPRKRTVEQSTAAHLNTNLKCLHTRAMQPAPTFVA